MMADTETALDFNRVIDAAWWGRNGIPHAELAELRESDPVWRYEGGAVDPFWLITRHADISTISKNPALWLNGPRSTLQRKRGEPQAINSLPQMDPPVHGKHRKVIQAWLLPRNLRRLDDKMQEFAKELVDRLAAKGEADLVSDLAARHPLRMICVILGVPPQEEEEVLRLSKILFAPQDSNVANLDHASRVREVMAFCSSLVTKRRANPTDDLVSELIAARIDGEPMTDHEITSHLLVLLAAGHDTTASALSGGMLALIRHPDQMQKVQADMKLVPSGVEEIVRYVTPTTNFMRTAVEDTELHGVVIPAGDDVCLHYAAANRDPRVFEKPELFLVDRHPNPHLGFGVGAHLCVGQVLARIEMKALLTELLPRLKRIELLDQPRWTQAYWISALKELNARFEIAA